MNLLRPYGAPATRRHLAILTVCALSALLARPAIAAEAEQPQLTGPNVVHYTDAVYVDYTLSDGGFEIVAGTANADGGCDFTNEIEIPAGYDAWAEVERSYDPDTCEMLLEVGSPSDADIARTAVDTGTAVEIYNPNGLLLPQPSHLLDPTGWHTADTRSVFDYPEKPHCPPQNQAQCDVWNMWQDEAPRRYHAALRVVSSVRYHQPACADHNNEAASHGSASMDQTYNVWAQWDFGSGTHSASYNCSEVLSRVDADIASFFYCPGTVVQLAIRNNHAVGVHDGTSRHGSSPSKTGTCADFFRYSSIGVRDGRQV